MTHIILDKNGTKQILMRMKKLNIFKTQTQKKTSLANNEQKNIKEKLKFIMI